MYYLRIGQQQQFTTYRPDGSAAGKNSEHVHRLTDLTVVFGEEPDAGHVDLPAVAVVEHHLDHVLAQRHVVLLLHRPREEAVVRVAPVHAHARPDGKLLRGVRHDLKDLERYDGLDLQLGKGRTDGKMFK